MKEQMILVRKHLNKKINKFTGSFRDELEVARINYQQTKNLVTKMFLQLRKQYGQDIPKFTNKAPTPAKDKESRRSIEDSPKINAVNEEKDAVKLNDNGEIDDPNTKSDAIYQMYGKRNEKINGSNNPLQDLYETKVADIIPILPFIQEFQSLTIFDPCCGNKAFGHVLMANGFSQIIERDLYTQEQKHDYLKAEDPEYDLLITNPPFQNKNKFVKKAYESKKPFVLLLPFEILTSKGAKKFFMDYGVKVIVLKDNPVFIHEGKDVEPLCCSYFMGNFFDIVKGTTTIIYL
jgi:hypothetical protein